VKKIKIVVNLIMWFQIIEPLNEEGSYQCINLLFLSKTYYFLT